MMSLPYQIEACVENFNEAQTAQLSGAHQIELCSNLLFDGLSPTHQDIVQCLAHLHIPIKVMVRPFSGSFITDRSIVRIMKKQIIGLKSLGVKKIVVGLTTAKGTLDIDTLCRLSELAHPMDITIHKAIDTCIHPLAELEKLIKTDHFSDVLTSGGKATAMEGADTIKKMIEIGNGHLQIVSAGKITNENLAKVHNIINGSVYHGRQIVRSLKL